MNEKFIQKIFHPMTEALSPPFQTSTKFPHSNFCIFASEIGALLGRHAFKSSEESMDKIMRRHSPDFTSLNLARKELILKVQEKKNEPH